MVKSKFGLFCISIQSRRYIDRDSGACVWNFSTFELVDRGQVVEPVDLVSLCSVGSESIKALDLGGC